MLKWFEGDHVPKDIGNVLDFGMFVEDEDDHGKDELHAASSEFRFRFRF